MVLLLSEGLIGIARDGLCAELPRIGRYIAVCQVWNMAAQHVATSISETTHSAAELDTELVAICVIPELSDVSGVVLQVHHTTMVLFEPV